MTTRIEGVMVQGTGQPIVGDKGTGVLPWEREGEAWREENIAVGILAAGVNGTEGGPR